MRVLLSWIREFVDVPGTAEEIGGRMSMRGLALEGIESLASGDAVLDFDVTANRPDCLSIRGIAREIATACSLRFEALPALPAADRRAALPQAAAARGPASLPVTIADADGCARYVAAIANVVVGPSPDWMQARLIACGQRPINNIVDVTNYVLLELGHPMHAFDLARLAGPAIVVRRAHPGEQLVTLDGKQRTLDPDVLVIADAERASAIGGVMGGADSEVSAATTQVVFESAWFRPPLIRATSRRLGMRTEASYRFERGADLTAPPVALGRALDLREAIGAGQRIGSVIDAYPVQYEPREVLIGMRSIEGLLGMAVPAADTERILSSLGFAVQALGGWHAGAPDAAVPMAQPGHSWRVQPPPWRVDIHRGVDVIEEVGRHHGFEHLPATFPPVEQPPPPSDVRLGRDRRVRTGLLAMGFSEAITFAFIEAAAAAPFASDGQTLTLANPLSEKFTTMRPSLLPGLIDAVSHNRRHGRRDVRLFEIGTRFSTSGETRGVAAVWTGEANGDHWSGHRREVDFYDIKGVAEQLCAIFDRAAEFAAAGPDYLIDGRRAEVRIGGTPVGSIGQIDAAVAGARELPPADAVFALEFDLDALARLAPATPRLAVSLPRHPSVVRDLAILIDGSLSAAAVRDTIRASSPQTLSDVREFDRYQGRGIPDGKVSLAVRLTFQAADRTLTDSEVQAAMQQIVAALGRELGAVQR